MGRYLHFMLNTSESNIRIKIAKEAPKVPYLMVADNCVIFYKATKRAVRSIINILENYENISGQLINF